MPFGVMRTPKPFTSWSHRMRVFGSGRAFRILSSLSMASSWLRGDAVYLHHHYVTPSPRYLLNALDTSGGK